MPASHNHHQVGDQAPSNQAPRAGKVSFWRFFSHLGSYLFNHKSDASLLTSDISALEAQRAEARAKQGSQVKASTHQSVADHDARIKHLAQDLAVSNFSAPDHLKIITPPAALKAAQLAEASKAKSSQTPSFKNASAPETTHRPTPAAPVNSKPSLAPLSAPASVGPTPPKSSPTASTRPPIQTSQVVAAPADNKPVAKPTPTQPNKHGELLTKKTLSAHNLSQERVEHTKQILKSKIENRAWNPYGLAQVNLIREHRSMFFNWQSKMLSMIFFVLLTCLICVLAYGYLLILEKEKQNSNLYIFTNLDNINKQIAVVQQELNAKIVPFNDKLMYTGYMLDNHLYWSNFFQFLEQETLSDVYYSTGIDASINGNVKGSNGVFEIWSVAKNYNAISNQTKVFSRVKSGYVLAVDATDTDSLAKASSTPAQVGLFPVDSSQAVRFKLKLTLDPRLFLRAD